MNLREQPGLDLLRNFDFLGGAALGFVSLSQGAPLRFHAAREFVETCKAEPVSVSILKAGVDASPRRLLGREFEVNPAGIPLFIFTIDIFGDKPDAGFRTDEAGDIVTEVDGVPVLRQAQVMHVIGNKYEGDVVSVTIRRGKDEIRPRLETGTGRFDLTSVLQPRHQHPASYRPSRADAPSCENIGRVVNTKVYTAHTDQDR